MEAPQAHFHERRIEVVLGARILFLQESPRWLARLAERRIHEHHVKSLAADVHEPEPLLGILHEQSSLEPSSRGCERDQFVKRLSHQALGFIPEGGPFSSDLARNEPEQLLFRLLAQSILRVAEQG